MVLLAVRLQAADVRADGLQAEVLQLELPVAGAHLTVGPFGRADCRAVESPADVTDGFPHPKVVLQTACQ